jgi:predicted membrane chloride channel (bestrophin family)
MHCYVLPFMMINSVHLACVVVAGLVMTSVMSRGQALISSIIHQEGLSEMASTRNCHKYLKS